MPMRMRAPLLWGYSEELCNFVAALLRAALLRAASLRRIPTFSRECATASR
jgi:hypothetical protein